MSSWGDARSGRPRPFVVVVLFVLGVLAVAVSACGISAPGGKSPSTLTTTVATQPVTKVSANTAPQTEIQAALGSAGVSDPARWAQQVVESRPYPADDPSLGKLRANLAKSNADQPTVDRIVSVLTP